MALAFLYVYGRMWFKDRRSAQLSPLFLASLVAGFWLILIMNGTKILDYLVLPVLGAPIMLAGWTAGRLLRWDGGKGPGGALARYSGLLIVANRPDPDRLANARCLGDSTGSRFLRVYVSRFAPNRQIPGQGCRWQAVQPAFRR